MYYFYIVVGRGSPGNRYLIGYQDVLKIQPDPCLIDFLRCIVSITMHALFIITFSLFALLSVKSLKKKNSFVLKRQLFLRNTYYVMASPTAMS